MFVVEFNTDGPEFAGFGDGDAAADRLRYVANQLVTGHSFGPVPGQDGTDIGRWGFEPGSPGEAEELRAELTEARRRIEAALEHLVTAPQHEDTRKATAILRGEE
jgi:hypothetical protein